MNIYAFYGSNQTLCQITQPREMLTPAGEMDNISTVFTK